MPTYNVGNVQDNGFELVFSNFEAFEKTFYDVQYTQTFWREVIPPASVDTNLSAGASYASYGVMDHAGRGGFLRGKSGTVPSVSFSLSKPKPIPLIAAGVSSIITLDEIRVYAEAYGKNLNTELMQIMRTGCEDHVESVFFFGDPEVDFSGWIEIPGVGITASGGVWSGRTADQIVADINNAVSNIFNDTRGIYQATTMYLPLEQYALLADKRMSDYTDSSVMDYVLKKNLARRLGKEFSIKSLPYLEGAGIGGVDRAVFQCDNPIVHKFPFPLAFKLLPPEDRGFNVEFYAEYKFGSYHCRLPAAMQYLDNI